MTEEEEKSNLTKTDFALETQLCITCPKLSQGYYWMILNNRLTSTIIQKTRDTSIVI